MADTSTSISVTHVSKLANIPLNADEVAYFEKSFGPIIDYMQKISQLDVENIPETTRTNEEENILRDDQVRPSLSQVAALQNAKHTYEGYFVVPAVIEKEE